MKYWLTLAALLCFSTASQAESGTATYDVMGASFTILNINVASTTAAGQMFSPVLSGGTTSWPNVMEDRKVLEIQNIDTTSSIFCGIGLSSSSVSGDFALTTPTNFSTTTGRKITPNGNWVLSLKARNDAGRIFIPWCVNDGGTATTKGTLSQGRNE